MVVVFNWDSIQAIFVSSSIPFIDVKNGLTRISDNVDEGVSSGFVVTLISRFKITWLGFV